MKRVGNGGTGIRLKNLPSPEERFTHEIPRGDRDLKTRCGGLLCSCEVELDAGVQEHQGAREIGATSEELGGDNCSSPVLSQVSRR